MPENRKLEIRESWLWGLCGVILALFCIDRILLWKGIFLSDNPFFFLFEFYLPPALAFLHALWAMGWRRAALFFSLAAGMGTLSEVVALRWGAFGAFYAYTLEGPGAGLSVQGFPLIVSLYWAMFMYLGYWIVSFPFRQGTEKSSSAFPGLKFLPGLVLLDGFCVTAIDLMMDPLQVVMGTWSWVGGGSYYNVPLGNFLGWYLTVCVTTALYRFWETKHPLPISCGAVRWIPFGLYLILFVGFALSALYLEMPGLVLIGCFVMIPLPLSGVLSGMFHDRWSR